MPVAFLFFKKQKIFQKICHTSVRSLHKQIETAKRGKQICCHNEALQATGQDEDKQTILLSAPALDIFQSCVYSKKDQERHRTVNVKITGGKIKGERL